MAEPEASEPATDSHEDLRQQYTNLQEAHAALLERLQGEGNHADEAEELQRLRDQVKELQGKVEKLTEERDELNLTVRDLRTRVEEGRRAIMRLQGQPQPGSGAAALAGAGSGSDGASSTIGHNKQDARRSMLPSWNSRETAQAGLGVITTPASPQPSDARGPSSSTHTPEELAELRKSKRASLAFGPHAHGTIGRRMHGHRRIASTGRAGTEEGENASMAPPPSVAGNTSNGGLRELQLGSATIGASSGGTSSKRASVMSSSLFRSPPSETVELPNGAEEGESKGQAPATGLATAIGSLLMPQRNIRRSSNSSSISGEYEANLAPPRSLSRMSQSPSQNSVASPIRETEGVDEEEDEPMTATAATVGLFGAQQQSNSSTGANSTYQLQRSLMESKARLRDRDDQIEYLKRQTDILRAQLDEAKDARKASEECLQALRDFVKAEGGEGGDPDALKGVKLPPLPTDQDMDDMEGSREAPFGDQAQSSAPSAWRSLGSSFPSFTRKVSAAAEPEADKALPSTPDLSSKAANPSAAAAPVSPAAQLTNSFNSLWSRATAGAAAGTRESASASSVAPSEGTSAVLDGAPDSKHTSVASIPGVDTAASPAGVSPSSGFKGWFSKRSTSYASESGNSNGTAASNTESASLRVSSPPFANLDNHVITLDQVNSPAGSGARTASFSSLTGNNLLNSRKNSTTSPVTPTTANSNATMTSSNDQEPTGRTKKAMEISESVADEDNGFVPPSF